MVCERCGEHEAGLKVSRVDRDRVLSVNLCAGCGRRGLEDPWPLKDEPEETARPGREWQRNRAGRLAERERGSED